MGNINDMNIRDLFYSEAAQNFIKKSANLNDKCRECKWLIFVEVDVKDIESQ
jgi:radical SAM protein with 4Fe4S-binding SPASM domain